MNKIFYFLLIIILVSIGILFWTNQVQAQILCGLGFLEANNRCSNYFTQMGCLGYTYEGCLLRESGWHECSFKCKLTGGKCVYDGLSVVEVKCGANEICVSTECQPDSDDDGVSDGDDNCPTIHNPNQEDVDGDLIGNVCDNCPATPNPGQEDSDGNGIGDACETPLLDQDGDSISDANDNCPATPNPGQEDLDGDGIGDACDTGGGGGGGNGNGKISQGLVPCGRTEDVASTLIDESAPCSLCHFFILIEIILEFVFFKLTPPLALLMLILGGGMFVLAAGNPTTIILARKIITSVLIGIAIIYGAFFLVGIFLSSIGLADWTETMYSQWWNQGIFTIDCDVPMSP